LSGLGRASEKPLLEKEVWRYDSTSCHILLAEDNLVNQTLALRLLEKQGYTVVIAANGQETLSALTRESFDVILMDVQMPIMDGFEATAVIRAHEKVSTAHLPIIAMTAHAMQGDRERCLAAGMDDYVTKPIKAADLYAAIERMIQATPVTTHAAPEPNSSSAPASPPHLPHGNRSVIPPAAV
jgi:CheY-like chemotaxis protein